MTSFVESNEKILYICHNNLGDKMNNHIESVFSDMLEDINFIKMKTCFSGIIEKTI